MKTLQKSEMLKRDQVRSYITMQPTANPVCFSLHTSERSATFLPSPTHHGLSNYTTRSKTRPTYILSWSFFLEEI